MRRSVWLPVVFSTLALFACSGGSQTDAGDVADVPRDTASDAPTDTRDALTMCVNDVDCSDGTFCNGIERCMPGASNADPRGCVAASPATPCLTGQTCSEVMMRCVTDCPHAVDADGDGHRAMDCGGDDCDDSDANRFPGNMEVCDAMNRDEDCDARTFGFRDVDMDSHVDGQCCNTDSGGASHCGDDCNDSRADVHPGLAEACDGTDNNCNTMTDEGVTRTFYPDTDHDGYGNSTGTPTMGCTPATGYAEMGGDCDDTASAVHPGAVEQCDLGMIDENCDGTANPAALCTCSGDISRMCALPGACAAGTQRCIGGGWGACTITPTVETCNGVDDNCDGATDEMLSVTCYPDADNDGYAASGATSVRSCPVPGRDAFAGCPPNQTNRAPMGIDVDCNDTDSTVSPGQPELCDAAMRDENCDGLVNPASLCMCTEGQSRPCSAPGSCGAGSQTCSGGHFSSCSVNPVVESCNNIDDDCDGMTDEGLTVTCYPDNDNDGYASMSATAIQSCPVSGRDGVGGCPTNQTNRAPAAGTADCNDMNAAISPGALEQCDAAMVDENCDGMPNPTSLCTCSGTTMRACMMPGACAAGTQTCSGGTWGNCSITPVGESCNNIDDDCDGMTDEGLTVTCYADADNDGFAAAGAASIRSCPVPGRESVGGCPTNQTNVAPAGANIDCADTDSARRPTARELCNGIDDDCDAMIDDGALLSFYIDRDRDGFGAGGSMPMTGCTAPSGYVANGDDCNDSRPDANPLGSEACDGIDQDCDGVIDNPSATDPACAASTMGGFSVCRSGACRIIGCPIGMAACAGGRNPVCDTNILTDVNNCGACGVRCGTGAVCQSGRCDPVQTLSTGQAFACAVRQSGNVVCWGANNNGQLGNGGMSSGTPPSLVLGLNDAIAVAAGGAHGCALRRGGTVVCWGANNSGQVGDGTMTGRTSATAVPGLSGIAEVAAGEAHNCARSTSGAVYCWGENGYGEIGNGTTSAAVTTPALVMGLPAGDPVLQLEAGQSLSCARTMSGAVWCWGRNDAGQIPSLAIGTSATTARLMPAIGGSATDVAIAGNAVCALRGSDGAVFCWGGNERGQLGAGTATPTQPAQVVYQGGGPVLGMVSIEGGGRLNGGPGTPLAAFACANDGMGRLFCWGTNDSGELGVGNTTDSNVALQGPSYEMIATYSLGGQFGCAREPGGIISCWGANGSMQLNDTSTTNRSSPTVAQFSVQGIGYTEMEGGTAHTCWRRATGEVRCWGANASGQVGDATTANRLEPVQVSSLIDAFGIANGGDHSCVARTNGAVACWGSNGSGELGDGTTTNRNAPVNVTGISDAVQVSVGLAHSCAMRSTRQVVCWGSNASGQLGDGTTTNRTTPVTVTGLTDAVEVRAGGSQTCARRATGAIVCWGANAAGQLGDGTNTNRTMPVTVAIIDDAIALDVGTAHACAQRAIGQIACWGDNTYGQLGDGTMVARNRPVTVAGVSNPSGGVWVGERHSCARRQGTTMGVNNELVCWGDNSSGQLGVGNTMAFTTPQVVNAGLFNNVSLVGIGARHACTQANTPGGSFSGCWGANASGQVGDNSTMTRTSPTQIDPRRLN